MYKLILDQVYRSTSPFVDISGHGNHAQGQNVSWSPDGAKAKSGVAVFNGISSRALVPLSAIWQDLYRLRVEVLVRFDPVQGTPEQPVKVRRHVLVEGPLSFVVFIRQDHSVAGMVMGLVKDDIADTNTNPSASNTLGATLTAGGSVDPFNTLVANTPETLPIPPGYKLDWVPVASAAEFTPDGQERTIEPGHWTLITFVHSGTSLWLYLDGVLAGVRHDIISPVLPVQGAGIHIGHAPGAFPDTLRGQIDELRIWKYDPHHLTKQFFSRPMDPEVEACWRFLLGRIEKLATDPATRDQMLSVLDCLAVAENDLERSVYQGGQPVVEQVARFRRRYDELWRRGAIDGPAMRALSREFISWIGEVGGDGLWDYFGSALKCIPKLKELDFGPEICEIAECDPAFAGFLDGFGKVMRDDILPCDPTCGKKRRIKEPPADAPMSDYDPSRTYEPEYPVAPEQFPKKEA